MGLIALSALCEVALIGVPRKPITKGQAIFSLIIDAVIFYLIITTKF